MIYILLNIANLVFAVSMVVACFEKSFILGMYSMLAMMVMLLLVLFVGATITKKRN